MSRLGASPGFVTAEPGLAPKRLTLKLQIALNQQALTHSGYEICFIERYCDSPARDGTAKQSSPKSPRHRRLLVGCSNFFAFRLVVEVKLASLQLLKN